MSITLGWAIKCLRQSTKVSWNHVWNAEMASPLRVAWFWEMDFENNIFIFLFWTLQYDECP